MTSPTGSQDRKAGLAAAKAAAAKAERNRRCWIITGVVTGVVAVAGGVTALAVLGSGSSTPGAATPSARSLAAQTGPPPWDAPDPSAVPALVQAAGLPLLGTEMTAVHFHAHLDVIVNGTPVPMNLGIGTSGCRRCTPTTRPA